MDSSIFSFGTKPLFEKIEQTINDREYPIDTLFINLGTFVRNCISNEKVKEAIEFDKKRGVETDRPAQILLEEAKQEMINFIQYIAQCFNNSDMVHNPTICSYHANYAKCIDSGLYKEPTHGKRIITLANEMVRTKLIVGKRKEATNGKTRIIELPLNDKYCPWRYLQEELRDYKNEHLVGMVSSHPVDYHIGSVCRTFRVFRSYTGDVIWYKNLGKIVFDTESIPFNIYTHAILGDKEDVKCSIRGGDKSKLFAIAEKEEWALKTKDYIRERLYKLSIRIPTNF